MKKLLIAILFINMAQAQIGSYTATETYQVLDQPFLDEANALEAGTFDWDIPTWRTGNGPTDQEIPVLRNAFANGLSLDRIWGSRNGNTVIVDTSNSLSTITTTEFTFGEGFDARVIFDNPLVQPSNQLAQAHSLAQAYTSTHSVTTSVARRSGDTVRIVFNINGSDHVIHSEPTGAIAYEIVERYVFIEDIFSEFIAYGWQRIDGSVGRIHTPDGRNILNIGSNDAPLWVTPGGPLSTQDAICWYYNQADTTYTGMYPEPTCD